jgi:hypothetical protein
MKQLAFALAAVLAVACGDSPLTPSETPSSNPVATPITGTSHFGGRYTVHDVVSFRCSYVDAHGRESDGADSNAVTVRDLGNGTPEAVAIYPPVPRDRTVAFKRLYLNVNGAFVAYRELSSNTTLVDWTTAEASTDRFPIAP